MDSGGLLQHNFDQSAQAIEITLDEMEDTFQDLLDEGENFANPAKAKRL